MNKIERLIQELCPNGVEWKEVGDVTQIKKGKQLNKSLLTDDGTYPAYNGGQFESGRTDRYNVDENTTIISQGGASAGFVNFITTKFWANAHCYFLLPDKKIINNKYLYHFIKMKQNNLMESQYGSGIPALKVDSISKIKIPIPPLEIQEEIVKILDKFTDYVTELTTELTLRQKQYHYYRDKLLSLENEEFESKKLGEVCNFIRGNGLQKKDFVEKGFPVIHYGQIYTKYGFSARDTISFANGEIYNKLRKAKRGDIIMATTSENIEDLGKSVVWEGEQEVGISGDSYIIQTSQNPRFINYYLQSIHFQLQKEKKVTGTKVIRINSKDMVNFDIKVPSLLRQKQIVSILDNFDVLTSNLVFGLPKEIELRKKQYEYYRDKLLSFD